MRRLALLLGAIAGAVGVAAAASRRLFKSREEIDWRDAERPGRMVSVDGVSLHYVERAPPIGGEAPAIVMLHGFGGHTYSFRHQLTGLSEDYRCVAIDLKGFGYSERAGGDYSLTEQARLVLGAMSELGIEKAAVIGHSLGGEVAMRMAEMAPARVERLVLAATVPGRKLPVGPRPGFLRPLVGAVLRLVAARSWSRLFYDNTKDRSEVRETYLRPARIDGSTNTVWEMMRDIRNDRQIDHSRLTLPVLILWAERERILPFPGRALRWLQSRLPQAVTERVPLTGHMLLEEQPETVNRLIRRFLLSAPAPEPVPAATAQSVEQPA